MKYIGLLLALLLLTLCACQKSSEQQDLYTKYDKLPDTSKPISFGEDSDVYLFTATANEKRITAVLDSTLTRTVKLVIDESYFHPILTAPDSLNDYKNYKNLVLCGTLDGTDAISTHIRKTLAKNLLSAAQKSGGELFTIDNQYVRDQLIIYLLAKDDASLLTLARKRSDQLFGFLLERYKQRVAFAAFRNKVVMPEFFENRPFIIQVPVLFNLYKDEGKGDFLSWVFQPTNPKSGQADKYISVHYEKMPEDKVDAAWIYQKRQELGKKYLEGDTIPENRYQSEPVKIAGHNGWRLYGAWENRSHGGFGGAFQTYGFWDKATKTAYLVDNVVYYPGGDKLPALLELEMISQSISLK